MQSVYPSYGPTSRLPPSPPSLGSRALQQPTVCLTRPPFVRPRRRCVEDLGLVDDAVSEAALVGLLVDDPQSAVRARSEGESR